jgi:alkaline phosphatase D
MIVTASATECRADWRYVDTIYNRSFNASTQQSLRVLPGTAQHTLATI